MGEPAPEKPSALARVRRMPKRGHYDAATVHAILDAALICHVGFVQGGQPFVIPTLHARKGDEVLLHGATSSRLMRHLAAGEPVCINAVLVDGLVMAKTVFNHSVNYRSVMVFGRGRPIDKPAEKLAALRAFTDKLTPGRWDSARTPNDTELRATAIVTVTIEQASAKVRSGPPGDEAEDRDWPAWAGVLPLHIAALAAQSAEYSSADLPEHVRALARERFAG
jgi:nitroimidazol reductase NimA-like FMN-containing flavoprotein (pyridoxamine 5'-phosphate oxidase superfamily)